MSNTFTPRSFCPGKKTWVGPLIACTAALAPAQTIYRVVGPDGKVTFTDRPPGNAEAAQQQQTAKPAPASETRPMPAASATEPATAKKANAAKATPADRPAAAPAEPKPVDEALLRALVAVLFQETLVRKSEELCISTLPTSMKRYGDAADGWRQRNAVWLDKAQKQMLTLGPEFQRVVKTRVDDDISKLLKPVNDASMHQRIKWCDQTAQDLPKGTLNLGGKSMVTGPLSQVTGH
jgi:hypothetical protein